MKRIDTIVIGAGQAGLAMSHCLAERSVPHVVLERGEVANSWRRERWDSLRLLTPNWQSRLPGYAYSGPDPDDFMSMPQVVRYLSDYAATSRAPVEERTGVLSVTAEGQGYRIATSRGDFACNRVVLASGACNLAHVPACAEGVPAEVAQLTPHGYRNPGQLASGPVLVVGASATGLQLAREIRAAGHEVILSAGEHIRMPRHYRGRDIQWWMEVAGIHATKVAEVDDIERARRLPSLQLFGSPERFMDLNLCQDEGIEVVGRLAGIRDGRALFSGSLANHCALSDLKMNRLLDQLDEWAGNQPDAFAPPERFAPTRVPAAPRLALDLGGGRVRTILWSTGFRPDFGWLDLPVFDRKGRLIHREGAVAPGLWVLGLPFLRRRNSTLIDGVGRDATEIAGEIATQSGRAAA